MKRMFLNKQGRPDVNLGVSYLSTRVLFSNESDWSKLLKMLGFLKSTIEDVLTLKDDNSQTLTWYIYASFAVYPDMKYSLGAVFTLGKEAMSSDSTEQKFNSRSIT